MYVRITVHDHQELDCRTHSLTQTFHTPTSTVTLNAAELGNQLATYRDEVVRAHKASYPRNRSFSIPIVEIEVADSPELFRVYEPVVAAA